MKNQLRNQKIDVMGTLRQEEIIQILFLFFLIILQPFACFAFLLRKLEHTFKEFRFIQIIKRVHFATGFLTIFGCISFLLGIKEKKTITRIFNFLEVLADLL